MKLKILFIINAILALVYGICFVLIPAKVLLLYGLSASAGEALMGQYFGVALLSIGLITWLARNVRQVCDGNLRCRIRYLRTVASETV